MIKLIPQKHFNDCFVAVSLMILNSYKISFNYTIVKRQLKDNSLFSISEVLKKYNIDNDYVKFKYEDLVNEDYYLLIAHLKILFSYHYIVIEKENDILYVYDPCLLKRHRINKIVLGHLSGYGILIKKLDKPSYNKIKFYIPFLIKMIFILIFITMFILLLLIKEFNFVII